MALIQLIYCIKA